MSQKFPFPQVIKNQQIVVLTADSVYAFDNASTMIFSTALESTNPWHIADFGNFVVCANGEHTIAISPDGIDSTTYPVVNTCCAFNGQLIFGGFVDNWEATNLSFVGWSDIGSPDFSLNREGVSGYAFVDNGVVLCVMPMPDGFVAYGTNGAWRFTATEQPVVGFSKQRIVEVPGIASRSAVASDGDTHIFIDNTGVMWKLQFGQPLKRLGFQYLLKPMLYREIVGLYDATEQAFYFSDGVLSFRYDVNGICQVAQALTALLNDSGLAVGAWDTCESLGFMIRTAPMDLGIRSNKTITGVEIGGSFSDPVFVSVLWRNDIMQEFRQTPFVRLNPAGYASVRVTAVEFKLIITSDSQRAEIDYCNIKYQLSDKRFFRGNASVD